MTTGKTIDLTIWPWLARRSNQSILKEISPECSLEGLMLKLKLQNFGHLMQRADSLEKKTWFWERLKAKGEEGGRGWDGLIASPTQWTWIWSNSWRQWKTEEPGVLQSIGLQRVRHDLATEQLQIFCMLFASNYIQNSFLRIILKTDYSSLF